MEVGRSAAFDVSSLVLPGSVVLSVSLPVQQLPIICNACNKGGDSRLYDFFTFIFPENVFVWCIFVSLLLVVLL